MKAFDHIAHLLCVCMLWLALCLQYWWRCYVEIAKGKRQFKFVSICQYINFIAWVLYNSVLFSRIYLYLNSMEYCWYNKILYKKQIWPVIKFYWCPLFLACSSASREIFLKGFKSYMKELIVLERKKSSVAGCLHGMFYIYINRTLCFRRSCFLYKQRR